MVCEKQLQKYRGHMAKEYRFINMQGFEASSSLTTSVTLGKHII